MLGVTINDQTRQPKGQPTGGQFAGNDRTEADLRLTAPSLSSDALRTQRFIEDDLRETIVAYYSESTATPVSATFGLDDEGYGPYLELQSIEFEHEDDRDVAGFDLMEHNDLYSETASIASTLPFRDEGFTISLRSDDFDVNTQMIVDTTREIALLEQRRSRAIAALTASHGAEVASTFMSAAAAAVTATPDELAEAQRIANEVTGR